MILGIGVDLVDVRRMEAVIFRWQEKFLRRVFTEKEIHYCNNKKNPAQRFATRFAAKEAFIKALFPKGAEGIALTNVEIDQKESRPVVNMYGKVQKYATEVGVKKIHLMVSHDGNYGIANVVLES